MVSLKIQSSTAVLASTCLTVVPLVNRFHCLTGRVMSLECLLGRYGGSDLGRIQGEQTSNFWSKKAKQNLLARNCINTSRQLVEMGGDSTDTTRDQHKQAYMWWRVQPACDCAILLDARSTSSAGETLRTVEAE